MGTPAETRRSTGAGGLALRPTHRHNLAQPPPGHGGGAVATVAKEVARRAPEGTAPARRVIRRMAAGRGGSASTTTPGGPRPGARKDGLPPAPPSLLPQAPALAQKRTSRDRESLSWRGGGTPAPSASGEPAKRARLLPTPGDALSASRLPVPVPVAVPISSATTACKRPASATPLARTASSRASAGAASAHAERLRKQRLAASTAAVGHVSAPSVVRRPSLRKRLVAPTNAYAVAEDASIELPANTLPAPAHGAPALKVHPHPQPQPYPSPGRELRLRPACASGPPPQDSGLMLSDYVADIYQHLRAREVRGLVDPQYMRHQPALDWGMRSLLLSWLSEVSTAFALHPTSMFLCASIVDRFLAVKHGMPVERLQLVGIAGLFIACKVEQVTSPSVHDFVFMVDGGYSALDILKAEKFMLGMLGFEVTGPSALTFHDRLWAGACRGDARVRIMAMYLLESALLDERFLGVRPSLLASAVVYLCIKIIYNVEWTEEFEEQSGGYSPTALHPCCTLLLDMLHRSSCGAPSAVYTKYSSPSHLEAAPFLTHFVRNVIGYVPPEGANAAGRPMAGGG